jgi:predicted protein tyrosine phosphatase
VTAPQPAAHSLSSIEGGRKVEQAGPSLCVRVHIYDIYAHNDGHFFCAVHPGRIQALHSFTMSRDDAEIPDQISEGLFLSNLATRNGEDVLRMFNITTICDLSTLPPFLSKPPKFSGMNVHEFAVLDDEDADIMPAAKQVLAIIAAQREQPSSGAVLVHCQGGISRSASAVIYSLMKLDSMSLAEAYRFVKQRRECIRPNAGFMRQLIAAGIFRAISQAQNCLFCCCCLLFFIVCAFGNIAL